MGANVFTKSMSYICKKTCATSLALNLTTDPSTELYLILKTHFDSVTFQFDGSLLYTQV